MNIIILSGGSGTRLWPLSTESRSKQFIPMFPGENGPITMIERVYGQIRRVDPEGFVVFATSKDQGVLIKDLLGDRVELCMEPARKNTFPAISLAAMDMLESRGFKESDAVIICPVDTYAEDSFYQRLHDLEEQVESGEHNLCLMGIAPEGPSEELGYILDAGGRVEFVEKPDKDRAKDLIDRGALWNSGVFGCKLGYILDKAGQYGYDNLYERYDEVQAISFDYAVVEKEPSIGVISYEGYWRDMGTWDTVEEAKAQGILDESIEILKHD